MGNFILEQKTNVIMIENNSQHKLWQYTGKKYQQHSDFWKSQIAQLSAPFIIQGQKQPDEFETAKLIYQFELQETAKVNIDSITKKDLLAIYVVVVSGIVYLLSRYTGSSTVVIDSPLLKANAFSPLDAIATQVPLITEVKEKNSLKSFIAEFSQIVSKSYSYQDFPYRELIATKSTPDYLKTNAIAWMPEIHGQCSHLNRYDLGIEICPQDGLSLVLHYGACFTHAQGFARHLQNIFKAYANRDTSLSEIEILSEEEKRKLLFAWGASQRVDRQPKTIHSVFEEQVKQIGEGQIALATASDSITYRELDNLANQLAHYLRKQYNIEANDAIGVMLGRSSRLIVGLLAVLKAGGAYVPIDPDNPIERIEFQIRDAGIKVVLMEVDNLPKLQNVLDIPMFAMDVQWEAIDGTKHPPDPNSGASDLAYILYTSGSTGTPKGVMVKHQSFVNMALAQIDAFNIQATDRVLQFANASFDASLSEIFMALLSGATLVLIDKVTIGDREHFIAYLDSQKVTVATLPPAYLRALERPDLKHLRVIITAGEAAVPSDARYYAQRLNYFNAYGPTETAVCATYYKVTDADRELNEIPIGQPIPNTAVYLFDQFLRLVPVGVRGEICVAGVGLAVGYINNPHLTATKFVEHPLALGGRLYRTGDYGTRGETGELIFLGRQDDLVKIRGNRVELGEVTTALLRQPGVKQAVAVAIPASDGNQEIVAYVAIEQGLDSYGLRAALSVLPNYMVPSAFVMLDALPLTPNGKLDRLALPVPTPNFVPPRTPTEEILAAIWAEVLGLEQVGIYDNFFEIGGHSLLAIQLISRIRQAISIEILQRELFENPTIDRLSKVVDANRHQNPELFSPTIALAQGARIEPIPREGNLPLSFAQQRLWFLDQLESDRAAYNIPFALHLQGRLHILALEQAVAEIVLRHEVLRTTFPMIDRIPVQAIASTLTTSIPIIDLQSLPENEQSEQVRRLATVEATKPFDLATGPLLRLTLLWLGEESYVLLLTVHHIISDAWSIGIFVQELAALYTAFCQGQLSPLPNLPIQYADFTYWQRQWLTGGSGGGTPPLQKQLDYWQEQLAGIPPLLELPTERSRPRVQTFQGASEYFQIDSHLTQQLREIAQKSGATLFMTLLAAFVIELARYSSQSDIVVGSPIANRNRKEIEPLIGCFVNTLPLRTNLEGNPTFLELLGRVRETALDAYAHQDLPFEKLVLALQPERSLSYSPLFQVMFVLHNAPMSKLELPGLTLIPIETESVTAKFDLTLVMTETGEGLQGMWEYNSDLFDAISIRRMSEHFQTLVTGIVANPKQRISELPLLKAAERNELLVEWNRTSVEYPFNQCVHQLFEAQVEQTPDAVAVVFENSALTYRELNCRANQLAHYLQKMGVSPEVMVGICVERSLEMVVGLLGILKAGGAYVPLDPEYPQERLAYMTQHSQMPVLLVGGVHPLNTQKLAASSDRGLRVVCLDTDWGAISLESEENPISEVSQSNLAYVIYTSGSTGNPKGVQICHQSLTNFLQFMRGEFGLTDNDVFLAVTTISFDIAGLELYLPLIVGSKVVLASREVASNGMQLVEKLINSGATIVQATPATWRLFLAAGWQGSANLKIICGGEALSIELANNLLGKCADLWNMYGPTETTIWSTIYKVKANQLVNPVLLGKPIANTQIYILDEHLQPVPLGVRGEMHVGGTGLARGYLNRPDLTAEKFIPNPFSDEPEARLYKTGDFARYHRDGNIQFLGRIDRQVKIRGFRIEPGEIEAVLAKHPDVADSVVLAQVSGSGYERLVAYVVSEKEKGEGEGEGSDGDLVSQLRNLLEQALPNYMIPSVFAILKALPLTPNGKIDLSALPAPDATQRSLDVSFVEPRTPTEKRLATIWAEVLGLERVGIHDNFFELGGDSILSIQIVVLAARAGLKLSPKLLFQHQTIAELAIVAGTITNSALAEQGIATSSDSESPDVRSAFPLTKLNEEKLRKISNLLDDAEE